MLHHLDFAAVADRLPEGATEADWLLLRGNLATLADYATWGEVLDGEIAVPEMTAEDRAFCAEAAVVAVKIDWSGDPWHALAEHLKTFTGRKGRALFHPLRLALTGREIGPGNGRPAQAHRPAARDQAPQSGFERHRIIARFGQFAVQQSPCNNYVMMYHRSHPHRGRP